MLSLRFAGFSTIAWLLTGVAFAQNDPVVGDVEPGRVVVPTNQVLTPAGRLLTFPGRPTDLAILEDQRTVVVKNLDSLIILDAETATILQTLRLPSGGHAVAGLAVADGGATIYTSATGGKIFVAHRDHAHEPYRWSATWSLPPPGGPGDPRRPAWRSQATATRCSLSPGGVILCCGSIVATAKSSASRSPSALHHSVWSSLPTPGPT